MLILAIYVDILIFASEVKVINNVKKALSTKFEIKDLEEATSVLGMRITTDKTAKTIKIDQSQYITVALARFSTYRCNATSPPIDLNQKLTEEMCPDNDDKMQQMKDFPYMEAVGCLLFAAQITRPDICFAVNM